MHPKAQRGNVDDLLRYYPMPADNEEHIELELAQECQRIRRSQVLHLMVGETELGLERGKFNERRVFRACFRLQVENTR